MTQTLPFFSSASSPSPTFDLRRETLKKWLTKLSGYDVSQLSRASDDASARRYFRLPYHDSTRIVMDAPPELNDMPLFLHIAQLLSNANIRVPERYEMDAEQGFLILEDFGDITMQRALNDASTFNKVSPDQLYRAALHLLSDIQNNLSGKNLVHYKQLLMDEMQLYPKWYLETHLKHNLSTEVLNTLNQQFELIYRSVLTQDFVFIHRDFHSRNLMCLKDGNLGVIDFQGALYGPITYDAASLLKDAYLEWPEDQILDWLIRYWEIARKKGLPVAAAFDDFFQLFEWTGLQRHLKILGIFARLNYRDHKPNYLNDLPLVRHYVRSTLNRYVELTPLLRLFDQMENTQLTDQYTF